MQSKSYYCGSWVEGQGQGANVRNAVNGEVICQVSSAGLNFKKMLEYSRDIGGKALQEMSIHDRANALKNLGKYLLSKKDYLYEIMYK